MTVTAANENTASNTDWINDPSTETTGPIIPDEWCEGAEGFKKVLMRLATLWANCREDGESVPTDYATTTVLTVLQQVAYSLMSKDDGMPAGLVTTDGSGGIRIEWWHDRLYCVTLVIGADDDSKSYVFVKLDDSSDGQNNSRVLPVRLASQLSRLIDLRNA